MVPAFDQEHEIEANIREIERRVADLGVTYEIVVVSDGSSDGTLEAASRAAGPSVRVTGYAENMGKGHALCVGSSLARGRYVAWCDSDLDLDPASLATFLEILRATDAGELLPRIAANRDFFECRFCPWAGRCWGLPA